MRHRLQTFAAVGLLVAVAAGAIWLQSHRRPGGVPPAVLRASLGVGRLSENGRDLIADLVRLSRSPGDSTELRALILDHGDHLGDVLAALLAEAELQPLLEESEPPPLHPEQIVGIASLHANVHGDSSLFRRIRFLASLSGDAQRRRLEGEYFLERADSVRRSLGADRAIPTYERAVDSYRRSDDLEGERYAWYRLGSAQRSARRYIESLQSFQRCLALSEKLADPRRQMLDLRRIGEVQADLRRYDQSETALRRSLVLAESLQDRRAQARARSLLGLIYEETGRLQESIRELQTCLQIYEETGDRRRKARALRRIAFTYTTLGDYDRALEAHTASLDLYREIDSPLQEAAQLTNLGDLHGRLGEHRRALEYHQAALGMFREHGTAEDVAIALANVGNAHLRLGRPDQALDHLHAALKLVDTPDHVALQAEILQLIGDVYLEQQDWDQAEEIYLQALEVNRQNGFMHGRIQCHLGLGRVALGSGRPKQAVAHFGQALELATGAGTPVYTWQANDGRGRAFLQLGDIDAAVENFLAAIDTIESSRGRITAESSKLGYFAEKQEVYDDLIRTFLVHKGDPRTAFDFVERAKARSFLDVLESGATVARQERATGEIEQELSVRGSASVPAVEEIQRTLGRKDRLIEYRVLPDRIAVWVLSRDEMAIAEVPVSRERVRQLVRRFRQAIGADHTEEFRQRFDEESGVLFENALVLGRELSSILVDPVWSHWPTRGTVYIVPDDILHYLPFAALPRPADTGRFLIESAALATAPSAAVLKYSLERLRPAFDAISAPVLAVADPLSDLPWARQSAESISELFPGTTLLVGEEARKSRLLDELAGPHSIVHFGTHGRIDEKSPLYSALHLASADVELPAITIAATRDSDSRAGFAPAEALRMAEVFGLDLRGTRLVVLSACETALGQFVRGEGLLGLSRAFMAAGVPTLITTLWKVDDRATARLMQRFYRHLRNGETSVAQALRQAQMEELSALRADPVIGHPHPYFWAPFIVVGRAD